MKYESMIKGIFLARPNRFVAAVMAEGREVIAHVKNTGRCRELLIPGVCVYLQKNDNPARKTAYSLIAVEKGGCLVNMDSQAPNRVAYEYIKGGNIIEGLTLLERERTYGGSRFDLYYETPVKKGFIEIKGVTLENEGVARFPDAPTQRGLKHVYELIKAASEGYEAGIIFVVQMENVRYFTPNTKAQPEFVSALAKAQKQGVFIRAFKCRVARDSLEIGGEIPVVL